MTPARVVMVTGANGIRGSIETTTWPPDGRQQEVLVQLDDGRQARHIAAFKEGTIEVTETDEEPVVSKRTHVVEEVVVSKDEEERTETVRDAVRRTEVEVEPLSSKQTTMDDRGFETYDVDFRSDYETSLASRGHAYDRWVPAYHYGYDLAHDRRYAGSDWTVIEPEAQRHWEERHQGTWAEFKNTIHYAWDKVRGRR
jgi:Domain of unknown function (DUF2382)